MTTRLLPLMTAFALGAALTLSVASMADDKSKSGHQHDMAGHSAGSMQLHQIMEQGQKMPMTMSGNVDRDFATMMTMHHQQAIKMADVELKHGTHAELKALAQKMKTAQQKEIQELAPHTKM